MLDNLLNKYLIMEEEKYPFIPKINEFDFCIINRNLFSERNNHRAKSFNKIYCMDDYSTYNKFNRNSKQFKGNSTSSFSYASKNFSDFNYLNNEFNKIHNINKRVKQNKNNSLTFSTKFKNILYKSLLKREENDFLSKIINSNKIRLNKTSSSFYSSISHVNSIIEGKNKIQSTYNLNNDFKKLKRKKIKYNSQKSKIPKNKNNIKKDKIFTNDMPLNEGSNLYKNGKHSKNESIQDISLFNKNNNSSFYNISSIGESNKNENIKNKSSEKKEHLFSFGSNLFFIDSNKAKNNKSKIIKKLNQNNKLPNKNNRKKNSYNNEISNRNNNIINSNNNLKFKSNIMTLTGNNHISTNYSGNNSIYNNLNKNLNADVIKKRNKNWKQKDDKNKLEMQSIREYYTLKEKKDNLKNEFLIFETTIQTLSDSKILDLAEDYMSKDNSLDSYVKKSVLYNKNHIGTNIEYKIKK